MNKKLELNNKIITSLNQWNQVESGFYDSPVLSVDTEFMREKTYYPQLCLVQLATDTISVCLDPLAFDLSKPLAAILENESITKILHSASQDIEVLGQYCDTRIVSLFDTQLAAEFAGVADQIGYSALVSQLLNVDLPKSQTRSNWAKRPLSEKQIEYSLNDVRYLIPLYNDLSERLTASNKYNWFVQEQAAELMRMSKFNVAPEHAYKQFKVSHRLNSSAHQFVKTLVNWREHEAQRTDKPKHWIVKDSIISQIAEQMPDELHILESLLSQDPRFRKKYVTPIYDLLNESRQSKKETIWVTKKQLTEAQKQEVTLLRKKIKQLAERFKLPPTRLGTRKDMVEYIQTGGGRLAQGWRAELLNI